MEVPKLILEIRFCGITINFQIFTFINCDPFLMFLLVGMNSVMKTQSRPSTGSLVSVTSKGEVCIFDSTAMEKSGLDALEKRTQDDGVCTLCSVCYG